MILFLKRLFCRHEKWHRIGLRLAKYDKDVNEFFDILEAGVDMFTREDFINLSDAISEGKDLTPFIPLMEWIRERMKEVEY